MVHAYNFDLLNFLFKLKMMRIYHLLLLMNLDYIETFLKNYQLNFHSSCLYEKYLYFQEFKFMLNFNLSMGLNFHKLLNS